MVAAAVSTVRRYSPYLDTPAGSTGLGIDQVIGWIVRDPGLLGNTEAAAVAEGVTAADGLNRLIEEGLRAIGSDGKAVLLASDLIALNSWVRSDPTRLAQFMALHGDDINGLSTGFHRIQNDGGNHTFRDQPLIDTILDGVYHFGFAIDGTGRFVNEDGAANALVSDVATWLTALRSDRSTTTSGLDRLTEAVVADGGLGRALPWSEIAGGADAADGLNHLILQGLAALPAGSGSDPTRIEVSEVLGINSWIRADGGRLALFTALHGDDAAGVETGFHRVQGDGATTTRFGLNLVDTVMDGIFHIGFSVNADGRFVNEDGNANALVSDVADWLSYYLGDPSTTGTGLDRIIDLARQDQGLAICTPASEINAGFAAADGLNRLLLSGLQATGVNADGWISRADLRVLNGWIIANRYADFLALHGDDEPDGTATGFHKIQNNGTETRLLGDNLINTVADGIYHTGFQIADDYFLNEDGNQNASLSDVSTWLNYFVNNRRISYGDWTDDVILGDNSAEQVLAYGGDDHIETFAGNDLLDGSWGNDTLLAGSGADQLDGSWGDDLLDGGDGSDLYLVSGNLAGGWQSFQGHDTYRDTGSSGIDRVVVTGHGDVDVGLNGFLNSGIEEINATGASGTVTLWGTWASEILDFSATTLTGNNLRINGFYGDDWIIGSAEANSITGGGGDDQLDGGEAGDSFLVTGSEAGGWEFFGGYDTYADSGTAGMDRILAIGPGDVDIGLNGFGPEAGIEQIIASGTNGRVRLLGTWGADLLDFSATSLVGTNLTIDAGYGDDSVLGSSAADSISGGGGDDWLNGGTGGDTYLVSGTEAGGWEFFGGYDNYADSGTTGIDRIVAVGPGDVDIGLNGFTSSSGIEQIIASGTPGRVRLLGTWNSELFDFSRTALVGGNLRIEAYYGQDTVIGSAGSDTISGGGGDDWLNGAGAGDTYLVSGNTAGGWENFQGFDSYADSGTAGIDRIVAVGPGDVDIGLNGFGSTSGIEQIDATGTSGRVTLLGTWGSEVLDFSRTTLLGSNLRIDGFQGNDSITGSNGADTIVSGGGDDRLNGGNGGDTYLVSGTELGGWEVFGGFDTYVDSGTSGIDRIVAVGPGNVDIGLNGFRSTSGIEHIDASGTSGIVTLLGSWSAEVFDFSRTTLIGANVRIDAGYGNDTITGSAGADTLVGGVGDDRLNGAGGSDTYLVQGRVVDSWDVYSGVDTFADSGTSGIDRIVAIGPGAVDIVLPRFGTANGIERIEAGGTGGRVTLLGTWANSLLDFSTVALVGSNIVIDGLEGNDTVSGSSADDRINGGSGADRITGGGGADTMTGGTERDTFVFSQASHIGTASGPHDTITDFVSGLDLIDLFTIDANTLVAGNQAFRYMAGAAFTGVAGELRLTNGLLSGDVNGDRIADFDLGLPGVTALSISSDLRL
jgi:Ca2+-binding RTX toxin-like protein